MQVLIRADASRIIGTGHVMRCLALADRLHEKGGACHIVCRDCEGQLSKVIESRGHRCVLLAPSQEDVADGGYANTPPPHAAWLNARWEQDAEETIGVARSLPGLDLIVVDHYGLDHRWETQVKPHANGLVVIDDLADREHNADLLIDQNYGQSVESYVRLMPEGGVVLAGPQFALLHRKFAERRQQALERRKRQNGRRRLLVFLGGGATGDVLDKVMSALPVDAGRGLASLVVITNGARDDQALAAAWRARSDIEIRVLDRVDDMAKHMTEVDLAIGGGGVSGWERCCLGLPSLVITMADNQRAINRRLAQDARIFAAIEPDQISDHVLGEFVNMDADAYRTLSTRAAETCDGQGIDRVLEALDDLNN